VTSEARDALLVFFALLAVAMTLAASVRGCEIETNPETIRAEAAAYVTQWSFDRACPAPKPSASSSP
jgi:hypothetical protein